MVLTDEAKDHLIWSAVFGAEIAKQTRHGPGGSWPTIDSEGLGRAVDLADQALALYKKKLGVQP